MGMKATIAALAFGVAAVVCTGAVAKDWKTVRIATEGAYAPWNGVDPSGKLFGFEIDLAADLCKRMGAKCDVKAQDWDGIIPALQQKKYDAIMAAMSITDERKKVIDFSKAYGTEPTRFAALKTSPLAKYEAKWDKVDLSKETPEVKETIAALTKALEGKTVGVQVSTIQGNFMEKYLPKVAVRTYDKIDNAGIDLVAGRIDAMLSDRSSVEAVIKADTTNQMVAFGPNLSRGVLGEGVGVGLRKADGDLKAMFDKAITEANKDGTISKLSMKHFGYDISIK